MGIPPPAGARTPPPRTKEQILEEKKIKFQNMDKNRDGKISLQGFLSFYRAESPSGRRQFFEYEFRKYDRNGDGFITLQEYVATVSLRDEFRALDKNRDGRLSRVEFLEGERQFRLLDRNDDGFITLDEYLDPYQPRPSRR